MIKLTYAEIDRTLQIRFVGSFFVCSVFNPNSNLVIGNILHVPLITRTMLSVSKFSNDNLVMFEFYHDKCSP